ncbi:S8 family serine peptidase [Streptomyces sp. NPDC094149]|uniref:S8 family serine peptidase n=1 Tax=Streptomyces sp. NPDC094149 TaxID=3155079 RepID=UPI00332018D1
MSDGTSDATAYVSAAAALVRAKYPDLTAGQVSNRLIKSASFLHHKGLKAPDEYGYGIVRPYSALKMNIPKGPEANPLGHIQLIDDASGSNENSAAENKEGSSSMGAIVLLVGVIGLVAMIGAVTAVVIARSRRNSRNGVPTNPGYPHMGYPTQQPMPPGPGYGYAAPLGQPPQQPNPYTQQPPHQG